MAAFGAVAFALRRNRRVASALPANGWQVARLLALSVFAPLLSRLGLTPACRLKLRSGGSSFAFTVTGGSDIAALDEVFVEQQYQLPQDLGPVETILDLGSNVGASVRYLATRYPQAHIYAFEPNPAIQRQLADNLDGLANVRICRYAVGAADSVARLHVPSGFSMKASLHRSGEGVEVPVRSIASAVDELGLGPVDLIKFDVEGAEYQAFAAYGGRHQVHALVGELHEELMGRSAEEFAALFPHHRVSLRKMRERRYIFTAILPAA